MSLCMSVTVFVCVCVFVRSCTSCVLVHYRYTNRIIHSDDSEQLSTTHYQYCPPHTIILPTTHYQYCPPHTISSPGCIYRSEYGLSWTNSMEGNYYRLIPPSLSFFPSQSPSLLPSFPPSLPPSVSPYPCCWFHGCNDSLGG